MKDKDSADVVARGARVLRPAPEFRWPGGRHVAVVFNIAYEGWSDGKAPGLGPMGNPLPAGTFDTNALSWGHYGARRGIERLARIFDRAGIRASVMTSGVFGEREPQTVKALAASGHEIVAHAYAQEIVPAQLSPEEVRADIAKTTERLAAAAGVRPVGWISPRGTPGRDTARFLLDAGYRWQGDVFDDDRPYVQQFETGRIVAIPLTMDINDLPHAMRFGRSPRQFVELFDDLLAHAVDGEPEALMIDVTAHAHVYGRPAGAWAIETIARKVKARGDVWIATRAELADHVAKAVS
ncbi:MAG TPA: polysaccharide deacetylase family protein [Xanthobacteraceae bacterium]|nr:polysaccharide deacetylase family protein [Xanthobacteraceae bacterium]